MGLVVGTDVGGTFTDTIVMDEKGRTAIFKVPSTPDDNSKGVLASMELAARAGGRSLQDFLKEVKTFYHGTTVGMNAVLTRKGAKVGFISTRGFKDALPMMRATRTPSHDALKMDMPSIRDETTLIPTYMIEEVTERVDAFGAVVVPLDMQDLARAVDRLVVRGMEALAVCLLWSIRNPEHERCIKRYVNQRFPDLFVSISSEVMPVIREYERSVVTLVNSYIVNIIRRYLAGLDRKLRSGGFGSTFLVMQSTGGALSVEEAAERPCQLFLSGPAGGVMGSLYLSESMGRQNVLTVDMGGTSCDIGVIVNGRAAMMMRSKLVQYDAALPKLDISTIGAGGGSIAWIEHGILLKVGPQSAGAEPGPACYDRGGIEPTVTDANVVLGYIDPDCFLDGQMKIREDLAREAVAGLGTKLGLGLVETAHGIIDVANANMVNAIRTMTVERGHDPRDFVMFCFGGAGPLHAGALMEELKIPEAVIPYTATAHSAYGFVCSDICHHLVASQSFKDLSDSAPFNAIFSQLEEEGRALLEKEGVEGECRIFKRYLDFRYCGQVFEITVDVPLKPLSVEDLREVKTAFEAAYEDLYGKGTGWKEAGFEVVNFRLDALGVMPRPEIRFHPLGSVDASQAVKGRRSCHFRERGGFVDTPVYDGDALASGMRLTGPAVIALHSTSTIVGSGQEAFMDGYRNVIIRQVGGEA